MQIETQMSETPSGTVDGAVAALLQMLVQSLVDNQNRVSITILRAEQTTIFEVKVDPEDVRRIIGRKGRTADAIREILFNLGSKEGRRYVMEIVEPRGRMTIPVR